MSSAPARVLCSRGRPAARRRRPGGDRMLSIVAAACGGRVFGKVVRVRRGRVRVARRLGRPDRQRVDSRRSSPCAGWTCRSIPPRGSTPIAFAPHIRRRVTEVTRVSRPWRRQGRRFVQVRLHVADIRKLQRGRAVLLVDVRAGGEGRADGLPSEPRRDRRCGRARCRTSAGAAASSWRSGSTCPARSSITTPATSRPTRRATSRAATSCRGSST